MRKFTRYYKNNRTFNIANIKSISSYFYLKKIYKEKNLSLLSGTDGNFRLSDVFAIPENPSEPVTRERKILNDIKANNIVETFARLTGPLNDK